MLNLAVSDVLDEDVYEGALVSIRAMRLDTEFLGWTMVYRARRNCDRCQRFTNKCSGWYLANKQFMVVGNGRWDTCEEPRLSVGTKYGV